MNQKAVAGRHFQRVQFLGREGISYLDILGT